MYVWVGVFLGDPQELVVDEKEVPEKVIHYNTPWHIIMNNYFWVENEKVTPPRRRWGWYLFGLMHTELRHSVSLIFTRTSAQ